MLQTLFAFFSHFPLNRTEGVKKTPNRLVGRSGCKSLTMTYFHTGTRTIIGAKSFHCPVRDGKEWYQLAMVIRHNFLLLGGFALIGRSGHCCFRSEFIESYQLNLIALWA